jgi:hypothetical protein
MFITYTSASDLSARWRLAFLGALAFAACRNGHPPEGVKDSQHAPLGASTPLHPIPPPPQPRDAQADSRADRKEDDRQVAGGWLEALRSKDAARLKNLTALPAQLEGFIPPNGKDCGPRSPSLSVTLRPETESEMERAVGCLLADRVVTDMPTGSLNWPEDIPDAGVAGKPAGYLKRADAERLPAPFSQHRGTVRRGEPDAAAFEALWTDYNGLTVQILLVVVSSGDRRVVQSALFHEKLEE